MKEPVQISNPDYSVDRIVARMKEAAERKGPFADGASLDVVTSAEFQPARRGDGKITEIDIHPVRLQPLFHPHSDGHYHVNDLLKYHDRTFIQNAYRAILKRGPDATGYQSFIDSLRSAQLNKIDILAQLRYSAEGRAKQVEIEGLRLPAMIRKAYRVPVLGYLLNLSVAMARLPLLLRNQQQFETHTIAQQEMIVEHLNHLDRTLRSHAEEVAQVFDKQSESSRKLAVELQQQAEQARVQVEQAQLSLARNLAQLEFSQQESIANQNELLHELRSDLSLRLDAQAQRIEKQMIALEQVENKANEVKSQLTARVNEENTRLEEQIANLARQANEATAHWRQNFEAFETRFQQWELALRFKEVQLTQADSGQREQLEQLTKELRAEVRLVGEKHQQVNTELVLQGERLVTLLDEARKRLPEPFDETQLRAIAREEDHKLDAFYASFDEEFRGSQAEIKRRLRVYLPIIRQQGIGTEAMPVLDVGCGRGEWLDLLREENLRATGVDSNRILVRWCNERGLQVKEDDLINSLHQLPDQSVGAITGFHIIEHLPIEKLVEFLNQAIRVLKTGGVVIFETPNPQNVLVGSCNFYFDPTHRNPLPSQVTKFLLESRGFVRVETLKLNPSDDTPVDENTEVARRFNRYFYGPMDYAVIGYRA